MNVLPTIQPNSSAIAFLVVIICAGTVLLVIMLGTWFNFWQTKRLMGFRFSRRKFKELTTAAEFSEEEKDFLESYLSHTKIPRFLEIFYEFSFGQSVMRQIFRATYTQTEYFSCDIEKARSHVFSMTQKLENYLHKSIFAGSTKKIPQGVRFYLDFEKEKKQEEEGRLIGKMVANHRHSFEIHLLNGNPKRIPKGTRIQIVLLRDGDHATYSSRVKGHSRSAHRHKKLLIMEHGKKTQVIFGARRYNRKELQTPAAIVALKEVGEDNFIPTGEMVNTLLCDISMTGCGVLSNLAFPIDSYISVSYLNPYDNETIRFTCQVVGHSKLHNTETNAVILQNRIVQIDDKDRNSISAYVYEFENEVDKIKTLEEQNSKNTVFDDKTIAVLKNRA